ncbi:MAG: ribosomal L7Ae/L30e/S12e/Gadd45 family protein [Clostridiales bacterium]|jgi:large subunit ribosomal protein L7A|nr:ribosomal L7Ae/L30e/S12e/Gadd45 family protein [Clostridiales bacterium]
MLEDIGKNAIIGSKQVMRAMQEGKLQRVYLANNVDAFLRGKVCEAARAAGVEVTPAPNMKELGQACRIDVGAACVGIPRERRE